MNREKFCDKLYQDACLKKCYKAISNKDPKVIKELIEALKNRQPFDPSDSSVLIYFDAQEKPHFQFMFWGNKTPKGWKPPESDQSLYSDVILGKVLDALQKTAKIKEEKDDPPTSFSATGISRSVVKSNLETENATIRKNFTNSPHYMKARNTRKFSCPFCRQAITKNGMINHFDTEHSASKETGTDS